MPARGIAAVMIRLGDVVEVEVDRGTVLTLEIAKIAYSTPQAGKITFTDRTGAQHVLSASHRVTLKEHQ